MADITPLILDDHEMFRREFAVLDDAGEPEQLRAIWEPLAALFDVHAVAEEAIFSPQLLRRAVQEQISPGSESCRPQR